MAAGTATATATATATTGSTKVKAGAKGAANGAAKQKSQMHRRSRTGCYTCRLRRKKCDEGSPMCTACKHLGLVCEYKRPMWWSNNDARRKQKDDIKNIIKRKKLTEKSAHGHSHAHAHTAVGSPPGLSHSLPTSATFTDLDRARSGSIDSQYSFNFNSSPQSSHSQLEYGPFTPQMHAQMNGHPHAHPEFFFSPYSPYEIDVKTERQMFINDVPTLRESTTSTFSTYASAPPPPGTILPQFLSNGLPPPPEGGEWTEQVFSERRESLTEETLNVNFFDFAQGGAPGAPAVAIELDEGDQRLLDHFVQYVVPTIFPILEANQHGSVSSDLILPALQTNKGYLHCCLSIAAQHYKAACQADGRVSSENTDELDGDIMRHRYATISALCDALNKDEDHQQILEAALGLIFFQCGVGRFDDTLPDIAWHQHFQAVVSLVQKLDLPRLVSDPNSPPLTQAPFNMTLAAWIDILGATMQGRAPTFAHTYREKHLSLTNPSLGLRELMGCEDRVMYLISEIACLEALKRDGMDDITLCQHVHVLGDQIGLTEAAEAENEDPSATSTTSPFTPKGTLSPKQLTKNITAAFRLAARIYLCSLVPGFSPTQASCVGLVDKLAAVLQHIPSGLGGFDRSLAWVYLVGGSVSLPGSAFRGLFAERLALLGEQGNLGSFGRVACLLRDGWAQNDGVLQQSEGQEQQGQFVHWRDVMQMKGWDYLLI
ncbi:fungal-specific transcription factor domain-containing protein [Dichotomopilus funicola]|uniref:Fungal-specific transcription factor domain-containing protein n=1 Tax=Dichotomopilus funicola TaxID=1934379 RepID=A0AAN6V5Y8_9PEZI|nr:fungal-specific transcription factor domain-containing protein [Dichotomopilus funicola]